MALKNSKATTAPETPPEAVAQSAAPNFADLDLESAIATDINLEDAIADQLLDDIDWSKVKAAMLTKVKQRFFTWLTNGNNTPITLSPFPELAALPSRDDERAA
ncbi:hypothetical protein H6F44_21170 [Pseudanabaena sp. FACHB-1277]|uniref:Uncharacterized protein n=1 Tax=Pseudanabaena cinerea FACHB-1277 TaxID=2949581 RepID=A0A926UWR4_9CYAN|nr:hypothetical protein [Pseudanabaena cinerea]MBD2152610.1 hypothetical protein [Pseudanabaena cinerea FACHB-1277]